MSIKHYLKQFLNRVAPQWTAAQLAARARAHSQQYLVTNGISTLNQKLLEHLGNKVLEGPFAGLQLSSMAAAEHIGPCLLGVYESELDTIWDVVFQSQYTQIIDIGAKFGFYAVGLAKRFPTVPVVAFDPDSWAQKAVAQLSHVNHVTNVQIESFCTAERLKSMRTASPFIICDCEGYEAALFADDDLSYLRAATLIIETHDDIVPGITERLQQAFSHTHAVHLIKSDQHRTSQNPLTFLTHDERLLSHNEFRHNQQWIFCVPKQ